MAATKTLRDPLQNSINGASSGASWRVDNRLYRPGLEVPAGTVDLSSAWYAQGHEVSS
jgi:hypothetical protein